MSIDPISAIGMDLVTPGRALNSAAAPKGMFDSLVDGMHALNQSMVGSNRAVESLAVGETDNLPQVMMGMEQTRLSFELMLQVRNKVLDAYQELMRMQI